MLGHSGSGKSRVLKKKIQKSKYKNILVVDFEGDFKDIQTQNDVNLFSDVNSLFTHLEIQNVDLENTMLVVDNGSLVLREEPKVKMLNQFKFAESVVSIQLNRNADVNNLSKEQAKEEFLAKFEFEPEEVQIEVLESFYK